MRGRVRNACDADPLMWHRRAFATIMNVPQPPTCYMHACGTRRTAAHISPRHSAMRMRVPQSWVNTTDGLGIPRIVRIRYNGFLFDAGLWCRLEIDDSWSLGGPGARKPLATGGARTGPTGWRVLPGRRGHQDPQHQRFPAGPKTMR